MEWKERAEKAEAERDKVRAEFAVVVKWHEQDEADYNELRKERDAIRAKTIEECAEICDISLDYAWAAKTIRALKEPK